jgi:hypothetical protein
MARDIGRGRTNVAQIKWRGLDEVLLKLGKQVGKIKGKTRKGLTIVVLKIRRDAVKLTPIQTGNLRASAYTIVGGGVKQAKTSKSRTAFKVKDKSGSRVQAEHQSVIESKKKIQRDPYGIIGFTAHYALAVHERVNAVGRRVRTGRVKVGLGNKRVSIGDAQIGQAKFLEEALIKNRKFILTTLAETAKI